MELEDLVAQIDEPTPRGIATTISMLIRTGEIAPGTRLPTVRSIGAALGVSPATVSHAWQGLLDAGLVQVRGRAGTTVLEPATPWLTDRSHVLASRAPGDAASPVRLDLAAGIPDPLLLPDLRESLARVAPAHATISSYLQPPMLPELEPVLRARWPYAAPALTVVDGAMDGVQRALAAVTRFGDRVVVESPGFPLIFDLLTQMNLMAVPAPVDREGIPPEGLRSALASRPAAVILTPRAHNPTGASMSRARAGHLAEVLQMHRDGRDTVVIEDDHAGAVSASAAVSLGTHLPQRTIHVLGFSKSHGPDLRIAALSGPAGAVEQIVARRVLGPGWTSRVMQAVLRDMLVDREQLRTVAGARHEYYVRQRQLAAALAEHGVVVPVADGLNAWIPAHDEVDAQVRLAAHGIRVSRGSAFTPAGRDGALPEGLVPHVRVSIGPLREAIDEVAAVLARATSGR